MPEKIQAQINFPKYFAKYFTRGDFKQIHSGMS